MARSTFMATPGVQQQQASRISGAWRDVGAKAGVDFEHDRLRHRRGGGCRRPVGRTARRHAQRPTRRWRPRGVLFIDAADGSALPTSPSLSSVFSSTTARIAASAADKDVGGVIDAGGELLQDKAVVQRSQPRPIFQGVHRHPAPAAALAGLAQAGPAQPGPRRRANGPRRAARSAGPARRRR